MSNFDFEARTLLLDKVRTGKLNLPENLILNFIINFHNVDGELRYYMQDNVIDELDEDTIKELNDLWY